MEKSIKRVKKSEEKKMYFTYSPNLNVRYKVNNNYCGLKVQYFILKCSAVVVLSCRKCKYFNTVWYSTVLEEMCLANHTHIAHV